MQRAHLDRSLSDPDGMAANRDASATVSVHRVCYGRDGWSDRSRTKLRVETGRGGPVVESNGSRGGPPVSV